MFTFQTKGKIDQMFLKAVTNVLKHENNHK